MLTIDRFQSAYHVPNGAPDRGGLQRRLDRLVRERLPAIIDAELRRAPVDAEAVYVIRRLELSLWLDAFALADGEVAERWGRLLASALVRAILYGGGDNVRRYDDGAAFIASFLGDLIDGTAWTQWAYDEFSPLEGLTAGQVATQLLAARPALLQPVAAHLARSARLGPLLQQIVEADAALLWDRGLGFSGIEARSLPPETALLLGDGRLTLTLPGGTGALFRRRLAAYLHLALRLQRPEPDEAIAILAHGLTELQELMAARPAPPLWQALARGEIESPAAIVGFLAGFGGSAAPARDWLVAQLSAPQGASRLAALIQALRPAAGPDAGWIAAAPQTRAAGSAFAGLALLLPALRDLGIHDRLGRDAVYQLLLDAVGTEDAALASVDSGVQLLAGVEPRDADRARRADVAWALGDPEPAVAKGEAQDAEGRPAVTLAVLRRFASRLRGFEASSPEYLARQFLRLPGHIVVDEKSVTVTLHQAPLGLVLQMNGLTGLQGAIPWLEGRLLSIRLPEASP